MIIVYVVLFCSTEILWLQIGKQKNKTQQECAAGQMCQIDTHRENCVGNRMCVHDTHAHALNACNNKKRVDLMIRHVCACEFIGNGHQDE